MTTLSLGPHIHLLAVPRPSSSPNNLISATPDIIESVPLTKTHFRERVSRGLA